LGSIRVGWRGAGFGRSCLFQRGIEDFDVALGAKVAEPIVEENVDLLLEQNLLDARGDFIEGWSFLAFGVERQQRVMVIGVDLLLGVTDALAETELNETENLEAVTERSLDKLQCKAVGGQEGLPTGVGGAIGVNAGGKLGAKLFEARVDFGLRGFGGLNVFLTHLLLNEGAADELLEGVLRSEGAGVLASRVEDREANLFIDVAEKDGVIVDDGYDAVENLRGRGGAL
jgi:hypothetical protein